ncbi:MAG: CDP-diacylglycerol--serine O-phosphatidyltransferase [Gammaproteobacteria bacterium]|nr:CDP-diacylglycerol--serine O-phosphatidyltransferase [Gammaproteobacteria bacterium]
MSQDQCLSSDDLDNVEQPRSRGVYLLPHLFTTAALFAGFYAVIAAMKGLFTVAPVAIFIAMLCDSLDGRVARLTNTQSAFGAEYDSLSDLVAFGVAPAMYVYCWGLYQLGKLGWLAAFFYVAATASRLARFNAQVGTPSASKRYFQGLACTSAAGFMASTLWVINLYQLDNIWFVIAMGVVTVMTAILMVSNILYRSFKDIDLKNKVSFFFVFIVIVLFIGIALDPPHVLFALAFLYAISGPVSALRRLFKKS